MMIRWISLIIFCFLLVACSSPAEERTAPSVSDCPAQMYADLSDVSRFAEDDQLPFQFPLEQPFAISSSSRTHFCDHSRGPASERKYHAAEDYFHPAGTPVYAIADGKIRFSGPMGGYGWLIIIDHPQANLYSLYGHLSPSRWRMKSGPVQKGDLIAYLGNDNENGGTSEKPLEPHLHLGIRAGQRMDYPAIGEWRFQAGWIKLCPADIGWLQPSVIITNQALQPVGFNAPVSSFLARWGMEILFTCIYLFGGVSLLIYATRQNKPISLLIAGGVLLAAGWFFQHDGWRMSYVIIGMGILLVVVGVYRLINRRSS